MRWGALVESVLISVRESLNYDAQFCASGRSRLVEMTVIFPSAASPAYELESVSGGGLLALTGETRRSRGAREGIGACFKQFLSGSGVSWRLRVAFFLTSFCLGKQKIGLMGAEGVRRENKKGNSV